MAQGVDNIFELTEALDQLENSDPKTRGRAAQRLSKLKDPSSISALAQAWRAEPDARSKKSIEAALQEFRRLELKQSGIRVGGGSGRLNIILVVVLVLTLIANGVLFASKNGLNLGGGSGGSSGALPDLPREDIIAQFTQRLDEITKGTDAIRTNWSSIMPRIATGRPLDCPPLEPTSLSQVTLADINLLYYPDVGAVNEAINKATPEYIKLRNDYTTTCAITNKDELKKFLADNGGDGVIVAKADVTKNLFIDPARVLLDKAIKNPAATLAPTPTATTPPTETPIPSATVGPTSTIDPNATAAPVVVDTVAPTSVEPSATPIPSTPTNTPTATPVPVLSYTGSGFDALKAYQYKVTFRYSAITDRNDSVSGTITIAGTIQKAPFTARYNVSISENVSLLGASSLFAGDGKPVYVAGNRNYSVIGGRLYITGDNVTGGCAAIPATEANTLSLTTLENRILRQIFVKAIVSPSNTDALKALDALPFVSATGNQSRFYNKFDGTDPSDGGKFTDEVDLTILSDLNVMYKGTFSETSALPADSRKGGITAFSGDYLLLRWNDQVSVADITAPLECVGK